MISISFIPGKDNLKLVDGTQTGLIPYHQANPKLKALANVLGHYYDANTLKMTPHQTSFRHPAMIYSGLKDSVRIYEQSPVRRQVVFTHQYLGGHKTSVSIWTPWLYYMVSKINGICIYASSKQINSIEDKVTAILLPNVNETGDVCLGSEVKNTVNLNLDELAHVFIKTFWIRRFNEDILEGITYRLTKLGSNNLKKISSNSELAHIVYRLAETAIDQIEDGEIYSDGDDYHPIKKVTLSDKRINLSEAARLLGLKQEQIKSFEETGDAALFTFFFAYWLESLDKEQTLNLYQLLIDKSKWAKPLKKFLPTNNWDHYDYKDELKHRLAMEATRVIRSTLRDMVKKDGKKVVQASK